MRTTPKPGFSKGSLRDDVESSGFRTMIGRTGANESFVFVFVFVFIAFGVIDDIGTILVKNFRVKEFEFADIVSNHQFRNLCGIGDPKRERRTVLAC